MPSDVTPTTTLVDGVPDTGGDAPRSDDDLAPPPDPAPCVVRIEGVGKCYHIYDRPQDRLKQAFLRWRRTYHREFWALRGVSLELRRGESVGIVGTNGAGKSTLLQIIAGTLAPTEGTVRVAGRVAALLELGSGFNHDFTGRENVYLNGAILGLSRREIDDRFDAIAGFADIGDFLDQPVKTYSSGMLVRLAFAVQVQLEPDVLIVDEALAVGDALFQKRCFRRLEELRSSGVTLLFVSHDLETVRTLTSRAVMLHRGSVHAAGDSAEILLEYRRLMHDEEKRWNAAHGAAAPLASDPAAPPPHPVPSRPPPDGRSFGDLDAEVLSVRVLDGEGRAADVFAPGDNLRVAVRVRLHADAEHLNVALRIRNRQGVKLYSWGTLNQDISVWSGRARAPVFWDRRFRKDDEVEIEFACDCALGPDLYEIQAAVSEERDRYYNDQRTMHWRDEAAFFRVVMSRREYFFGGVADLRMRATVRD